MAPAGATRLMACLRSAHVPVRALLVTLEPPVLALLAKVTAILP
jgi:hypothetical protein